MWCIVLSSKVQLGFYAWPRKLSGHSKPMAQTICMALQENQLDYRAYHCTQSRVWTLWLSCSSDCTSSLDIPDKLCTVQPLYDTSDYYKVPGRLPFLTVTLIQIKPYYSYYRNSDIAVTKLGSRVQGPSQSPDFTPCLVKQRPGPCATQAVFDLGNINSSLLLPPEWNNHYVYCC